MNNKLKVLVVDRSLFFRMSIQQELIKEQCFDSIQTATTAKEARDKIIKYKPNVITLDANLPDIIQMDFLTNIVKEYSISVIIIGVAESVVFEKSKSGVVDFINRPQEPHTPQKMQAFYSDLSTKIKASTKEKNLCNDKTYDKASNSKNMSYKSLPTSGIIAIGASTGGTEAINSIISKLPEKMPGIVIVQHMPPVFTKLYAQRLDKDSVLKVKEAENGDMIKPGEVLVAPGDYQMTVYQSEGKYFVKCKQGEKVSGHCPSVDVLFSSVAKVFGKNAIGIILTGMGADGAKGMKEMHDSGAYNIGQDKDSSIVYGMPMMAYKNGAVDSQVPLDKIPEVLLNRIKMKNS